MDLMMEQSVIPQMEQHTIDSDSPLDLQEFRTSRSLILYPAYFDARKSHKQGRRVPLDLAVNTDLSKNGIPLTAWHLATACSRVDLLTDSASGGRPVTVIVEEGKRYSRDYWGYGRVRVKLPSPAVTKTMIIRRVAQLLPAVQLEQLASIRAELAMAPPPGSSARPPLASFDYPLRAEDYPYCQRDAASAEMLKYGYGALPLVSMRPKVNSSDGAGSSGGDGAKANKKKGKKKR